MKHPMRVEPDRSLIPAALLVAGIEVVVVRCKCGHGWPIARFPNQTEAEWAAYRLRQARGLCDNCIVNLSRPS